MNQEPIAEQLHHFLEEWYDSSPTIEVQTSGSTGVPKRIHVEKIKMLQSAQMTCQFLGVKKGDSALLCMPLHYIGGKMMVVRSLVAELDLWTAEPTGNPMKGLSQAPTLVAMTPQQVYNTIQRVHERMILQQAAHLIIGGSAIDETLEVQLRDFPNAVWSSYGMTETLSHIALRRLNGPLASKFYKPLDGITVQLSDSGTLVINAPRVCDEVLETNDLAYVDEQGEFSILGRKDNTINSGGIKIQAEELERLLSKELSVPFMITSRTDEKFGEIVVLLFQKNRSLSIDDLEKKCNSALSPYWRPKLYLEIEQLPLTPTGKLNRAMAKRLVEQSLQ